MPVRCACCDRISPGQQIWQGKKDSNLRMLESKSSALTSLAIPLQLIPQKLNCKRDCYLALEQFDRSILLEDFAKYFLVLWYPP